jgi:predicted ATPase
MYALFNTSVTPAFCGNFAVANARLDELMTLAAEKDASYWRALGILQRGYCFAQTGRATEAITLTTTGIAALRSTGATNTLPMWLLSLAIAHADLEQFDSAWRNISDAITTIETTKEKIWEAEVHRVAGEIALKSPMPLDARVEGYFERALAVARQQQANPGNSAPP